VREQKRISVEHPFEINSLVDSVGEINDFGIGAKILTRCQYPCQQEGGIDGGYFAIPSSLSGFRVQPMIEPSALLKSFLRKKAKCVTRSFHSLLRSYPLSLGGNAKSGQTKTCGRDTRNIAMTLSERRTIHSRAVGYQACLRIRLLPKVLKGTSLEVFNEDLVLA
jgi:hypothetical protein